jgi:hypothetical protein
MDDISGVVSVELDAMARLQRERRFAERVK